MAALKTKSPSKKSSSTTSESSRQPSPTSPPDVSLSNAEMSTLGVFRQFMVAPGEMLCFHGPLFQKHGTTLRQLTEKRLVLKERFKGGFSLTNAGFAAMNSSKRNEK